MSFLRSCALAAVVLSGLGACRDPSLGLTCRVDADCPALLKCDVELGACVCTTDAACGAGEFCNGRGCQRRVGCTTSLECEAGWFCDTATGTCLEGDLCTNDVQCAIGSICNPIRFQCETGCRTSGDCLLGQVCRCEGEGESSCEVGQCLGHSCDDDTYCDYGERCLEVDGERRCTKDERGPFCEGCQLLPGLAPRCPGDEANFCLLDRKVNYRRTYCGVDCSEGQPCPRGYTCRNILRLTSGLCQADTDCAANGPSCASDDDCPGARCDVTAGRCGGKCQFNEDSVQGFCTCSADSECPKDTCDAVTRRCAVTRKPCTLDGEECERAIYCVNLGDRAACLIGKNCVPEEGLTCEDVRHLE